MYTPCFKRIWEEITHKSHLSCAVRNVGRVFRFPGVSVREAQIGKTDRISDAELRKPLNLSVN